MRALALGFVAMSIVVSGATSAGAAKEKPEIDVLLSGLISSQVTSYPHQVDGAKAAAKAILKKNGVKINITVCNDGLDPNLAAGCARQAVSDGMDAVVGGISGSSAALLPTLEAAKIPYFGSTPQANADYQSPIAFPFVPGIPAVPMSQAPLAKKLGCKKVGVLAADQASSQVLASNLLKALNQIGLQGSVTNVPLSTPDYAPYVAQTLDDDADCIVVSVPGIGQAITAIRQSTDPKIPIITGAAFLNPQLRATLGSALDGVWTTNQWLVAADPTVKEFKAEMAAYSPDQSLADDFALLGWANVHAVYQASQNVKGEVTSASLIKAADKTTFDLGAYPKPINFAAKPAVKTLPRLKNTYMTVYEVKDGEFVPSGAVDISNLISIVYGGQ